MSNDLISQANALIEKHATSGYIHRDATLLLPRLVGEITRLRADNDFLHKFVDDPGSTLEAALNAVREQSEVIRKQQTAFADAIKTAAATLTKWQQIAIDERAQIIQYHRGILHPLDRPSNFWESMPKDEYAECRDLATKELGLQGYKTNGPIEINGERYVKESKQKAYVERIENDFIFYARSYEYLRDPDKWRPHQERYEKAERKAQAALEKIRRGQI